MQVAVEGLSIASMADDAMSVASLSIKPEPHRIHLRKVRKLPRMHQLRRFWFQDLRSFVLSILQMRDHEMRHVHPRYGRPPGRCRFHASEPLARFRTDVISRRVKALQ